MIDPKFCGELEPEEKTFTQKIADIITKYEQMLVDWDAHKVSEEKMLSDVEAFQLKSRPMMLDMLDEFKTINNILGYLRTMISSARIASMYGVEVSDDLKDIIDEVDFLRDKIKFNKEEPVIGRSAGVDEIEEFLSEEEEDELYNMMISDKKHAQIIATRLNNYIRYYVKDELHLIENLNKILK